jgi:hypothetical protein
MDRPDIAEGQRILRLIAAPSTWTNRRVESVEFLDDQAVRKRISVDLDVPESTPCVPLALLAKEILVDLDTVDETGRPLPVLTRGENTKVAWAALAAAAQKPLDEQGLDLDQQLLTDLRALVSSDVDEAQEVFENLLASHPHADLLHEDASFMRLASQLIHNFLFLVRLDASPRERRILKFSYRAVLESPGVLSGALASIGFRRVSLLFDVPALGTSASYHFECEAPEDLEIEEGVLLVDDDEQVITGESSIRGSRVHMYLPGTVSPEAEKSAIIFVQRSRTGFVRIAALSAIFSSAVLTFFWNHLSTVANQPDRVTAILLVIPGLLSLLASRPGEHRLASRFFFGTRVLVAVSGLLAYSAAATLAIALDERELGRLWETLVYLSWATSALLFLGLVRLDSLVDQGWAVILELWLWLERRKGGHT